MRAPVLVPEGTQVKIARGVAADDEHVFPRDKILAVFHRARGAERSVLAPVLHAHAEAAAVAEVPLDLLGQAGRRAAEIPEAAALQKRYDMLEHRRAEQLRHGLRHRAVSDRGEPRPSSSRQNDRFHLFIKAPFFIFTEEVSAPRRKNMQTAEECGEKGSHSLDICGILYSVFLSARSVVPAGMGRGYFEQPQTAEICRARPPHVPAHHAHIRACNLLFRPLQPLYRLRRGGRHGAARDLRAHPRAGAPEGAAGVR